MIIKNSVYRNEYAPAILLDCRGVCYYVYEKFSSAGGDKEDPPLHSKWPKGEPNPYGAFFSGRSYLADVGGGVMNVTFEPGCRNNWHIHHGQVQVLICVAVPADDMAYTSIKPAFLL